MQTRRFFLRSLTGLAALCGIGVANGKVVASGTVAGTTDDVIAEFQKRAYMNGIYPGMVIYKDATPRDSGAGKLVEQIQREFRSGRTQPVMLDFNFEILPPR